MHATIAARPDRRCLFVSIRYDIHRPTLQSGMSTQLPKIVSALCTSPVATYLDRHTHTYIFCGPTKLICFLIENPLRRDVILYLPRGDQYACRRIQYPTCDEVGTITAAVNSFEPDYLREAATTASSTHQMDVTMFHRLYPNLT